VPTLTVVAGPNGSGKSTLTQSADFDGLERLLDPDALARDLAPENPSAAAVAAGRQALKLTEEYLNARVSFAVETTLAGHRIIALMREAKERGYGVNLAFVALNSPEKNISRIRDRVARGGHFIPDLDVRRRYARSFENLPEALRLADLALLFDNSGNDARPVLIAQGGKIVWQAKLLPAWLSGIPPNIVTAS
jgi:predicted ABC-type ATPase